MRLHFPSIIASSLFAATTLVAQESELESEGLNFGLMPTMPENVRIASNGDAEYNHELGIVRYLGGVQVFTDNGIQIFANQALVDLKKDTVHLNGDVSIYQNAVLHKGDRASYNYKSEELDTKGLRTSIDPILLDSETFTSKETSAGVVFIGKNAGITTEDKENPSFWIRADEIEVYPSEEVIFRDLKLYVSDTPIFWLPYLSQPLNEQLGYHFVPGGRSNWGGFLLNTYGIMLGGEEDPETGRKKDQWLLSEWHFDFRSKRGIGTGLDLTDTRLNDNENLGWLKTYYINDLDPTITRSSLDRGRVNEDRYGIELKYRHEWQPNPERNLIFDINSTWLSDEYYLEDFKPGQYTTDPQPENVIGIRSTSNNYQAGLFSRVHLNDFYQSDARFPEIYFDHAKRPIWGDFLLHEGSSSIGYYREDLADDFEDLIREAAENPATPTRLVDEIDRLLERSQFGRLHTYQELSTPFEITNGFTVTPRAGAGYSYYWDEGEDKDTFSSPHGYLGIDTAMKFTRVFSDVKSDTWGLNQLLHVIQPYTNLSILSTNELGEERSKIDRLTRTERPRPFDVARYTTIDDYRNWSIVRMGTRNQLITKRDGRSHTWLTLDTYIDSFLNDPESNRDFSNIYNDLEWHPVPWCELSLRTQFPINSQGFTEITTSLDFLPHKDIELFLSHSFLDNHPTIEDSNLIKARMYFRLNHQWGIGTNHKWQLDDNVLERQEYSIHRNFSSWNAGLGFFQRDNRLDTEYGALLSISLNALPNLSLPFSVSAE